MIRSTLANTRFVVTADPPEVVWELIWTSWSEGSGMDTGRSVRIELSDQVIATKRGCLTCLGRAAAGRGWINPKDRQEAWDEALRRG